MTLLFFYLLLVKHAIADLWLQARLVKKGDKTKLKTPRLWIHALDHTVLTFLVALVFVGVVNALWLSLLDFVAHFAIDYAKSMYQKYRNVSYSSTKYWQYATVDQILHFTTYLIIVLLAT